jgi:hypothetical protein
MTTSTVLIDFFNKNPAWLNVLLIGTCALTFYSLGLFFQALENYRKGMIKEIDKKIKRNIYK